MTSDMQQTWSKPSRPCHWYLTLIPSVLGYSPWWHCGRKAWTSLMNMWKSDVYHLLPICRMYFAVRPKFSNQCVLPYVVAQIVGYRRRDC